MLSVYVLIHFYDKQYVYVCTLFITVQSFDLRSVRFGHLNDQKSTTVLRLNALSTQVNQRFLFFRNHDDEIIVCALRSNQNVPTTGAGSISAL